jgi:hypothetical protein
VKEKSTSLFGRKYQPHCTGQVAEANANQGQAYNQAYSGKVGEESAVKQ